MPKLFVAVDLPAEATEALARIRPPPAAGVRLTEPGQMHLTLHALGEGDVDHLAPTLQGLKFPGFSVRLQGVGQFSSAGGAVTLWAGVQGSPDLLGLHAAVAAALAGEGFRPDARPYVPHITLAQCEPGVARGVAAGFLTRHAAFLLAEVPLRSFGLFSITSSSGAPVCRRERAFPL